MKLENGNANCYTELKLRTNERAERKTGTRKLNRKLKLKTGTSNRNKAFWKQETESKRQRNKKLKQETGRRN